MKYDPLSTITSIVAKRGSGKTELLKHLIRLYKNQYKKVFLISPSEAVNNSYTNENLIDKECIFYKFNENWLMKLIEKLQELNKGKTKQSQDGNFVLIILDDCLSDINMRSSKIQSLKLLASRGRHFLVSVWITAQSLKMMCPLFRQNSDYLICGKMIRSDVENIAKEYACNISQKELMEQIEENTNNYGFVIINNCSNGEDNYGTIRIELNK